MIVLRTTGDKEQSRTSLVLTEREATIYREALNTIIWSNHLASPEHQLAQKMLEQLKDNDVIGLPEMYPNRYKYKKNKKVEET
jgi:hypothetical protein